MKITTAAKRFKTQAIFWIVRSRRYWVLGLVSAIPEAFSAFVGSLKIMSPQSVNVSRWILWAVAIVAWLYAIIHAFEMTDSYRRWKIFKRYYRPKK